MRTGGIGETGACTKGQRLLVLMADSLARARGGISAEWICGGHTGMGTEFRHAFRRSLTKAPHDAPPDRADQPLTRISPVTRFLSCCRKAAIVGLLPLLLTGIAGPSYAQQAFSSPDAAAFAEALATDMATPAPGWQQVTP